MLNPTKLDLTKCDGKLCNLNKAEVYRRLTKLCDFYRFDAAVHDDDDVSFAVVRRFIA